ncbi:hypothetical protein Tco_1139829 [Tanacetum coccineum]
MSNDPLSKEIGSGDRPRTEQDDLIDFVPPTPHDSPLSGGHTPRSDEDLVINKLQKKVKRLEKALRARTLGMKLFKIGTSRRKENVEGDDETQGRNTAEHGDTVNTTSINVSVAGPSNVSTAGNIFEDEMVTITDTLMAIRSTRPRTT